MGGGDLNLKKSWHPHTIRNQEKVWKAEQAKMSEDKRLKELQKEIRDEKERDEMRKHGQVSGVLPSDNNPKLEWMYKSSSELLNRDEYLLGKAVDKNFEELDKQEKDKSHASTIGIKSQKNHVEHEVVPFSIREYKGVTTSEQVDLQRKLMEDPLMAIRQKEMESRRKILENPVKLKELHRILKTQTLIKKGKKKSKKHKKDSKKKKRRRRDSSSSSSSSQDDLDKMLVKQIKEMKKNSTAKELEKILDTKYDKIAKELDKAVKHKKSKKKSKKEEKDSSSDNSSSNTPSPSHKRILDSPIRGSGQRLKTKSLSPSPLVHRRNRSVTPGKRTERTQGNRSFTPNPKYSARYRKSSNSPRAKLPENNRSRSPARRNLDIKRNLSRSSDGNRCRSREERRSRSLQLTNPFKNQGRQLTRSSPFQSKKDNPFNKNPSYNRDVSPKHHPPPGESHSYPKPNRMSPRYRDHHNRQDRTDRTFKYQKQGSFNRNVGYQASRNSFNKFSKISEEEKQKRLQEMTRNAAWRDEDRTRSVKRYRDDYRREEEDYRRRDFDNNFMNKQVHKAYNSQNSVESRLKSHKNNIQRSAHSMNSNFARK